MGLELTKLTYTRLEDNLICHRCGRISIQRSGDNSCYLVPGSDHQKDQVARVVTVGEILTVIVTACSAFGLTTSEAKTEIMCLQAKGGGKVSFTIIAAGQA